MGRAAWVGAVAVVGVASFGAGRITLVPPAPESTTEQASFRAAVLTSPTLEAPGLENADASWARARGKIERFIANARASDPSLSVSVYARDLEGGSWIGIDDRELYLPSSLTKVAILVYTLQREEGESGYLSEELVFDGAEAMLGDDSMGNAPDSLRLHEGVAYSRRELMRRMIAYSDNFASQMLMADEGGEGISRMLYDLSAEQVARDGRYYFDARTTAVLLRTLYYSSYLSRRHSELALDMLTANFFEEGLRRHLPADVTIASKFGYHGSVDAGRPHHELHECGIVYRTDAPYVVCVMTRTQRATPEGLDAIIGEVSWLLWVR